MNPCTETSFIHDLGSASWCVAASPMLDLNFLASQDDMLFLHNTIVGTTQHTLDKGL